MARPNLYTPEDLIKGERELTPEEVDDSGYGTREPGTSVQRLRERHHRVAQYAAAGLKQATIAAALGYSEGWVSQLLSGAQMQELVSYYRERGNDLVDMIKHKTHGLAMEVLEKVEAQVAMDGTIPMKDLTKLLETVLDRSGVGPTSVSETRSLMLTGAELLELKQRGQDTSRILEPAYVEEAAAADPGSASSGAEGEGPVLESGSREGPLSDPEEGPSVREAHLGEARETRTANEIQVAAEPVD